MKNVVIAGPMITPQNPKVVSPASIAKKITKELIFDGVVMAFSLTYSMIKGFINVSAIKDITKIE
jgi:hypothetical protein